MNVATPLPITTGRLIVRPVALEDLPDLMAVNGDDLVTRHLPYATWRSPADAHAWFDRMQGMRDAGAALQFVVCERASDRAVGTCLLFRFDTGSARAELGYVLRRSCWGRGYMAEALRGLLASAFGPWNLRRVEAEVNPVNTSSVRVLERLGFVREGLLRQRWLQSGIPYDVAMFGLLAGELALPGAAAARAYE